MATATKALTVAEATERAEQARDHLDDLTERLTSGDGSVTREQLEEAKADAEYADLALKGAHVRERREAEEALRAEVEQFRKGIPKRAAAVMSDVSEARTKAEQALKDYADAIAEMRNEAATAKVDYGDLRPPDVPLDFDGELPDWYRSADPKKLFPKVDIFPALLSVARDVFDARRTGHMTSAEAEVHRAIGAFVVNIDTNVSNARLMQDQGVPS